MKNQANPWDFFDRIYCISIKERGDRRKSAIASFDKVGLTGKVEFVIINKHPTNVMQGMYESHMACLRKGLEVGARNIVIFEDDVVFERFNPESLKSCTEFLTQNPGWKVLLLGALLRSSKKTANPCVQKVRYQSLGHAYVLNRHYAETLAYQPWQGIINDTLFRPLKNDIYAIYPMFAFQEDFASDNDKYPALERFRRLLGGLKGIQKANEFYHRHKFSIYAAQVIVILLVLILLFYW
jgi:glycosyl transferase, family 25